MSWFHLDSLNVTFSGSTCYDGQVSPADLDTLFWR